MEVRDTVCRNGRIEGGIVAYIEQKNVDRVG
jgi:hypothetical protein